MAERTFRVRGCGVRRLGFEPLESRYVLATITVTSLADNLTVDGQVTLREAIRAAELNISVDGSTAGSVATRDTIQFEAGLSGAVNLSSIADSVVGASALTISSSITIRGNANGITIQRDAAASEMRVFRVTATGNFILENLSVSNGLARGSTTSHGLGGAIYNAGTLEINSCTVYQNRAIGGDAAGPDLPGGGRGGAIYSIGGTTTIVNSTVSGNSAESGAGPSVTSSFGGAVCAFNSSVAVYNSTLMSNSATGGSGIYVLADGLNNHASLILYSSIVTQPAVQMPTADIIVTEDQGGTTSSGGTHNIAYRALNFSGTYLETDPMLGPLANNGGSVMTHALLSESPALQEGVNPLALATDARGATFVRVVGGQADIGAFEMQAGFEPELPGDYNESGKVDVLDYVVWRMSVGQDVNNYEGADGSGDGEIDDEDHGVWAANFGDALSNDASMSLIAVSEVAEIEESRSAMAALADHRWFKSLEPARGPLRPIQAIDSRARLVDQSFENASLLLRVAGVRHVRVDPLGSGYEADGVRDCLTNVELAGKSVKEADQLWADWDCEESACD